MLAPRMRQLKTQQQIICVTRDEHILISGDAEQVIVTQSEEKLKVITGDVNNKKIQKHILEIFEGDAMAFTVPFIQAEDESWVPDEEFSQYTRSLHPGTRVRIRWEKTDCCRIIRRIERIEDEE